VRGKVRGTFYRRALVQWQLFRNALIDLVN